MVKTCFAKFVFSICKLIALPSDDIRDDDDDDEVQPTGFDHDDQYTKGQPSAWDVQVL